MTKHLTFITPYLPCQHCKQALLNASHYIPTWGFGGLYLFADGHVMAGYATGEGNSSPVDVLDAYLSKAVELGICHDITLAIWLDGQLLTQKLGKDHLGAAETMTDGGTDFQ